MQLVLSEADTLKSSSMLIYLVPRQSICTQLKSFMLRINKSSNKLKNYKVVAEVHGEKFNDVFLLQTLIEIPHIGNDISKEMPNVIITSSNI